jgi:hypothetical protein
MSRSRNSTGPDQDGFSEEDGSAEIGESGNSAVGYGKPPKHARFKPGQSCNPKGRPKGRASPSSVIARLLNEKVTVREGDRIRKMSWLEAACRALLHKATKGDMKAFAAVTALEEEHPSLVHPPPSFIIEFTDEKDPED